MADRAFRVVPRELWPTKSEVKSCQIPSCGRGFGLMTKAMHCNACGRVCCPACVDRCMSLPGYPGRNACAVCDGCGVEIAQVQRESESALHRSRILSEMVAEQNKELDRLAGKSKELREENEALLDHNEVLASQVRQLQLEAKVAQARMELTAAQETPRGSDYGSTPVPMLSTGVVSASGSTRTSPRPTSVTVGPGFGVRSVDVAVDTGTLAATQTVKAAECSEVTEAELTKRKRLLDVREATLSEALKKVSADAARLAAQRTQLQETERTLRSQLGATFDMELEREKMRLQEVVLEELAQWHRTFQSRCDEVVKAASGLRVTEAPGSDSTTQAELIRSLRAECDAMRVAAHESDAAHQAALLQRETQVAAAERQLVAVELNTLRAAADEHRQAAAAAVAEAQQAALSAKEEMLEKLQQLAAAHEAERSAAQQQHRSDVDLLRRSHKMEVERLVVQQCEEKGRAAIELEAAVARHQEEMQLVRLTHGSAMEELRVERLSPLLKLETAQHAVQGSGDEKMAELTAALQRSAEELDSQRHSHHAALTAAQAEHAAELAAARAQWDEAVAAQQEQGEQRAAVQVEHRDRERAEHAAALAALEAQRRAEGAAAREVLLGTLLAHEEVQRALHEAHAVGLLELVTQLAAAERCAVERWLGTVMGVQEACAEQQARTVLRHAEELKAASQRCAAAEAAAGDAVQQLTQRHKDDVHVLQSSVSALRRTIDELREQLGSADAEGERRRCAVAEANAAARRAEEDSDAARRALDEVHTAHAAEMRGLQAAHAEEVRTLRHASPPATPTNSPRFEIAHLQRRIRELELLQQVHLADVEAMKQWRADGATTEKALGEAHQQHAMEVAALTARHAVELQRVRVDALNAAPAPGPELDVARLLEYHRHVYDLTLTQHAGVISKLFSDWELLRGRVCAAATSGVSPEPPIAANPVAGKPGETDRERQLRRELIAALRQGKAHDERAAAHAMEVLALKRAAADHIAELASMKERCKRVERALVNASNVERHLNERIEAMSRARAPAAAPLSDSQHGQRVVAAALAYASQLTGTMAQQTLQQFSTAVEHLRSEARRRRELTLSNALVLEQTTASIRALQEDLRLRSEQLDAMREQVAREQGDVLHRREVLLGQKTRLMALSRSLQLVAQDLRRRELAMREREEGLGAAVSHSDSPEPTAVRTPLAA